MRGIYTCRRPYKPGVRHIDTTRLKNAAITWQDGGQPHSADYGDIFFSREDPVAESRHVFLDGNNLAQRLATPETDPMVIGECGFGFGLNFLLTREAFQRLAPSGARLHYISSELHPVTMADMQRYYRDLPAELGEFAGELLTAYPEQGAGYHRLTFAHEGRQVILDLLYGDANESFAGLSQPTGLVDAWYLDGFAPGRNEALWTESLFRTLASLSRQGATLATYSVAGAVRRNLEAAGFTLEKSAGFGNKRHMLKGRLDQAAGKGAPENWASPWTDSTPRAQSVAVVGAGLAGCATAYALCQRGLAVTLIDRHGAPAGGASGNPRGIVHFKPARRLTTDARFRLNAFCFALRHYKALARHRDFSWHPGGLLQLAGKDEEMAFQQDVLDREIYALDILDYADPDKAASLTAGHARLGGLFFPGTGALDPAALCRSWASEEGIERLMAHELVSCAHDNTQWQLSLANGENRLHRQFDAVIICSSFEAGKFPILPSYPLRLNHGQLDTYVLDSPGSLPPVVLCRQSYAIPWQSEGRNMLSIGGSFARGGHEQAGSREALAGKNLDLLNTLAPGLHTAVLNHKEIFSSRRATRCTTPDYLPVAGPVEDRAACEKVYAGYARDARQDINSRPATLPGLYINVGLGSRGLTTAPLLAEYIASLVNGESLPLSQDEIAAIHPLRFTVRDLKTGKS